MDKDDTGLLDGLSADELAILDDELKNQLSVYLKHLVGLAGVYEHIERNGASKPKQPFYYSCAILEVNDAWYLATAGHILEKIDAVVTRSDTRLLRCGLDDTHAPGAIHKLPIPSFDYTNARRFWRCNDHLDFGLIYLHRNCRDLLSANGIEPLKEHHWDPNAVASADTLLMVGFPEDSIDSQLIFGARQYNARVKGHPAVILVNRTAESSDSRFVGQISPGHEVGSIVGMSGGPIFCFRECEFEPFWIAAIQSSWLPDTKTTFGCTIPTILDVARDFLAETSKQ